MSQIVTFSTLGKRQALRDVGKAFGMTEAELSNLTRMLVRRFGTLADEYENNQRFKAEVLKNGKLKPYWVNTSGNGLIKLYLKKLRDSIFDDFTKLLDKKNILKIINDNMRYKNQNKSY
mgnify:CR=1 FL=1